MANEKRLIDADAEIEAIKKYACEDCDSYNGIRCRACWADDLMSWIDDAPKVDAVSRGVVDQIRWERDVAIKQLEEHGIPFCGIAPDVVKVVRCKDCKWHSEFDANGIALCWEHEHYVHGADYCSCGERNSNVED